MGLEVPNRQRRLQCRHRPEPILQRRRRRGDRFSRRAAGSTTSPSPTTSAPPTSRSPKPTSSAFAATDTPRPSRPSKKASPKRWAQTSPTPERFGSSFQREFHVPGARPLHHASHGPPPPLRRGGSAPQTPHSARHAPGCAGATREAMRRLRWRAPILPRLRGRGTTRRVVEGARGADHYPPEFQEVRRAARLEAHKHLRTLQARLVSARSASMTS